MTDIFGEMKKYGMQLPPGWAENNPYLREDVPPGKPPSTMPGTQPASFSRAGNLFLPSYYVSNSMSYARGAAEIRDDATHPAITLSDGKIVHRPSTFRELIEVRSIVAEKIIADNPQTTPNDLEALLKTTDVFNSWFWTCTSAAYQAKTTKFKITPISEKLITIPKDSTESFLKIPYARMPGKELDGSKGIYNKRLTKDEFLAHEGWDELLEHDADLKTRYANIIFRIKQEACAIYIRQNTEADQVRALCAYNLNGSSNASGNYNLYNDARFLRVSPNASPPQGGGAKK